MSVRGKENEGVERNVAMLYRAVSRFQDTTKANMRP